ncbi:MAG: phage late control D family protein [Candidatus Entotheonellia bacterium]
MMDELFLSAKIEGEEVNDLLEQVDVEENDSRADLATLTFGDSHLILSDILHEGLSVEVDLGRTDTHALIFRGMITGIRAHFPSRGQSRVEVQAVDSLIHLGFKPRTRSWWNTTVSQMVRDIALANGFLPGDIAPEEDAMVEETRPRQQVEETDLAFLHRLAQAYDCKLYVEHGKGPDTLNFVATKKLLEAEPIEQTLTFNANLEEFSVAFDAFATAAVGRLVTTDPLTGGRVEISEDLVGPAEAQWVPDPERMARLGEGAARLSSLLARAAAKRVRLGDFWRLPSRDAGAPSRPASDRSGISGDQARRLGQTGRGRAAGSIWLRPRRRVNVEGYGGRWSGDWYLARVRHELDLRRRLYVSAFICTR